MTPPADHARLHSVVHGLVQGVHFRAAARVQANRLHLTGRVWHRRDGAVEAIAEGPRPALDRFLAFLQKGPPRALVERVDATWSEPTGAFEFFDVAY